MPALRAPTLICAATFALLSAADHRSVQVREYKADGATLLDISPDGKLILTKGARIVHCQAVGGKCRVETLAVYNTQTGEKIRERVTAAGTQFIEGMFFGAAFIDRNIVRFAELRRNEQTHKRGTILARWDPASNAIAVRDSPFETNPVCPIDEDRFLFSTGVTFQIAGANSTYSLQQPLSTFPYDAIGTSPLGQPRETCRAARSGSSLLIYANGTLHWVSIDPHQPPQVCHSFPDERVHGYTISHDRSLLAAITSTGPLPVGGPDSKVFLNVLSAPDCNVERRLELSFPEKPKWTAPLLNPKLKSLDNIPFVAQFANQLAISPDNKMLALAYGIRRDGNGYAYVGLYSLGDGHRFETIAGDAYKCGIFHGAILSDELECWMAPVGAVQFSPDSKTLFASSLHLHQWLLNY